MTSGPPPESTPPYGKPTIREYSDPADPSVPVIRRLQREFDYVMICVLGTTSFRENWRREVRWARCNRVSRPTEYPGLVFSFCTPLATAYAVYSKFDEQSRQVLAVSLLLRWIMAWLVAGHTGDRSVRRWLRWLPVRDVLSALVWLAGGVGRRIVWRDEEFIVEGDGRMRPVAGPAALNSGGVAAGAGAKKSHPGP